jgi:hypothetical protein
LFIFSHTEEWSEYHTVTTTSEEKMKKMEKMKIERGRGDENEGMKWVDRGMMRWREEGMGTAVGTRGSSFTDTHIARRISIISTISLAGYDSMYIQW